jgi:hypothetical protein
MEKYRSPLHDTFSNLLEYLSDERISELKKSDDSADRIKSFCSDLISVKELIDANGLSELSSPSTKTLSVLNASRLKKTSTLEKSQIALSVSLISMINDVCRSPNGCGTSLLQTEIQNCFQNCCKNDRDLSNVTIEGKNYKEPQKSEDEKSSSSGGTERSIRSGLQVIETATLPSYIRIDKQNRVEGSHSTKYRRSYRCSFRDKDGFIAEVYNLTKLQQRDHQDPKKSVKFEMGTTHAASLAGCAPTVNLGVFCKSNLMSSGGSKNSSNDKEPLFIMITDSYDMSLEKYLKHNPGFIHSDEYTKFVDLFSVKMNLLHDRLMIVHGNMKKSNIALKLRSLSKTTRTGEITDILFINFSKSYRATVNESNGSVTYLNSHGTSISKEEFNNFSKRDYHLFDQDDIEHDTARFWDLSPNKNNRSPMVMGNDIRSKAADSSDDSDEEEITSIPIKILKPEEKDKEDDHHSRHSKKGKKHSSKDEDKKKNSESSSKYYNVIVVSYDRNGGIAKNTVWRLPIHEVSREIIRDLRYASRYVYSTEKGEEDEDLKEIYRKLFDGEISKFIKDNVGETLEKPSESTFLLTMNA